MKDRLVSVAVFSIAHEAERVKWDSASNCGTTPQIAIHII